MIKNLLKYIFKKVGKIKINVTVNGPKFQIIQKFRQYDRDALILTQAFNQDIKSSTEQWCSQVSKVLPRSFCDANSSMGLPHTFSIFHKDKKEGIDFPSFSENAHAIMCFFPTR